MHSIIEHVLFLIILCLGYHEQVSFCFCITVKVIVSLAFFIWETNEAKGLPILRYSMQFYHELVSAGETVHQQSGASDRMFNLQPSLHPKPLNKLLGKMFHSPCVGFVIPNIELKKMTVSAVYVLTCHNFLSYAVVSYTRWVSWVGCGLLSAFWFGDITNDYSKGIFLSDAILQSITLLDIANLVKYKLEDEKMPAHFNRSSVLNWSMFMIWCAIIWMMKSRIPIQMHYCGYFIYLITCTICGFFVHLWTKYVTLLSRDSHTEKSFINERRAKAKKKKRTKGKVSQ